MYNLEDIERISGRRIKARSELNPACWVNSSLITPLRLIINSKALKIQILRADFRRKLKIFPNNSQREKNPGADDEQCVFLVEK